MADYSFSILTAGGGTAVISEDPGGGGAWLDDFVDYPKAFGKIYEEGKKVSTSWHGLFPQGLERFPVLGCFEHQVLSFWTQVLRDRLLAENLIEMEKPEEIVLSGRPLDTNRIADCLFDPGLFEHTLALAAKDRGIKVAGQAVRQSSGEKPVRLGAVRAAYASLADRLRGARLGGEPDNCESILISRQAASRLGRAFLDRLERRARVVVTEADLLAGRVSLYELAAGHLSPGRRMSEHRGLWKLFDNTTVEAWGGRFICGGHDYAPIARAAVGGMLARHAWMEMFRQQLLEEYLRRHRPKSLLALYDHGLCEAQLVEVCRRRGIRTVTLQHGLANRGAAGYLPIMSDTFACWGRAEREALIAQGADLKKLTVTGFPGFDGCWAPRRERVPRKPYRALVATQGVQASVGWHFAMTPTPRLVEKIMEHCSRERDVAFTVRLHPNESISETLRQRAEAAGIVITQGAPLGRQFEEHDAVVTQFSTVGAEALLAGLPLVSLNWAGEEEAIPYAEGGAAARSRRPQDLAAAVIDAVEGRAERSEAVARFLGDHLCGPGAEERLTELMLGRGAGVG